MIEECPSLKSCASCPIRHRAVCARCEPEELSLLEEIKFHRSYESGQRVVWIGDRMDFVASVISGVATLSRSMEDGRTQMVGLLLPSDFLGRPGRALARYDIEALSDLTLCCFRREAFEKLVHANPRVGHRLLEMTCDELDAARDWMVVLGRKTAREKIASLLSIVAHRAAALERGDPNEGASFELPLTRLAMADYLGLTIETVSRQISALKRDGVIELDGPRRVVIPNFPALIREAGNDADESILGVSGNSTAPSLAG